MFVLYEKRVFLGFLFSFLYFSPIFCSDEWEEETFMPTCVVSRMRYPSGSTGDVLPYIEDEGSTLLFDQRILSVRNKKYSVLLAAGGLRKREEFIRQIYGVDENGNVEQEDEKSFEEDLAIINQGLDNLEKRYNALTARYGDIFVDQSRINCLPLPPYKRSFSE